jgi:hypothetical protein
MKTFAVTYPSTPRASSTVRTEIRARSFDIKDGVLLFFDEVGTVVSAFQTWIRIDRVFH